MVQSLVTATSSLAALAGAADIAARGILSNLVTVDRDRHSPPAKVPAQVSTHRHDEDDHPWPAQAQLRRITPTGHVLTATRPTRLSRKDTYPARRTGNHRQRNATTRSITPNHQHETITPIDQTG
jgi:hypothetical protein